MTVSINSALPKGGDASISAISIHYDPLEAR
jgi:hypothetical protein